MVKGIQGLLVALLEENLGGFIDGLSKKNLRLKVRKGEVRDESFLCCTAHLYMTRCTLGTNPTPD